MFFNIYINGAPQSVKNKMNLYANGLKIISPLLSMQVWEEDVIMV